MLTVHLWHNVALLQDYIQAMGACLIQLESGNDASVTDELHQLTSEAMTLIACRSKTQQPSVSPVMNEDLMAGTQRNGVMHLDSDHYRRILVRVFACSALSDDFMTIYICGVLLPHFTVSFTGCKTACFVTICLVDMPKKLCSNPSHPVYSYTTDAKQQEWWGSSSMASSLCLVLAEVEHGYH